MEKILVVTKECSHAFWPYFFSFQGRIGRGEFWAGTLLASLLAFAVVVAGLTIDDAITGEITSGQHGIPSAIIVYAGMILNVYMSWAVCTKRFHDHGSSGWCLILFVPAVGLIFFLVELGMIKGMAGVNEYGTDPVAVPPD